MKENVSRIRWASGLGVLAFSLVGAAALAAEPRVDISKLPAAAAKPGVTFDKDIKPLVEKSCLKCHSGEKPKGKYVMETREGVLKGGGEHAPAVRAGKVTESPMLTFAADLVPDMEMPPVDKRDKFPALTKDQVALVRAWVEQGAK